MVAMNITSKPSTSNSFQPCNENRLRFGPRTPALVDRIKDLESMLEKSERNDDYRRTKSLIRALVLSIDEFISEKDQERVYSALKLAIKLHLPQGARADGQPMINHVMRVAINLMHPLRVRTADTAIAALLHDAVEDQARALAEFGGKKIPANATEKEVRELAFEAIRDIYGGHVERLDRRLTNADYRAMAKSFLKSDSPNSAMLETLRNSFYQIHVYDLATDRTVEGQEAFSIKTSDIFDNALRHAELPMGTPEQREFKAHLTCKRGVLMVLLPKIFESSDFPVDHPLYPVRIQVAETIRNCFERHYRGSLSET